MAMKRGCSTAAHVARSMSSGLSSLSWEKEATFKQVEPPPPDSCHIESHIGGWGNVWLPPP